MILFLWEVKIKLNPGKALCTDWESGATNIMEYQVLAKNFSFFIYLVLLSFFFYLAFGASNTLEYQVLAKNIEFFL